MKIPFKLLTAAVLAVGTPALAAGTAALAAPADEYVFPQFVASHQAAAPRDSGYTPTYASYTPGPGYFAWQESAPGGRDATGPRHGDRQ